MNAFKNYISSFFSGLSSLLKGMRVTIRVFFRKKTTEQYPENRDTLQIFDRFRGELVMPHNANNGQGFPFEKQLLSSHFSPRFPWV